MTTSLSTVQSFINEVENSAKRALRDASKRRQAEAAKHKPLARKRRANDKEQTLQITFTKQTEEHAELGATQVLQYTMSDLTSPSANRTRFPTVTTTITERALSPSEDCTWLHKKLQASPFLSNAARSKGALKTIVCGHTKSVFIDTLDQRAPSCTPNESNHRLKARATEILAGARHSDSDDCVRSDDTRTGKSAQMSIRTQLRALEEHSSGRPQMGAQGSANWAHDRLLSKWRGEVEREQLWELWTDSQSALEQERRVVLPLARVERHPLFAMYHSCLAEENARSVTRTLARIRSKRYVLDLHEVWLTNLSHFHDHQATEHGHADQTDAGTIPHGRKDVNGIQSHETQIQSVSSKYVLRDVVYPRRMASPDVQLYNVTLAAATLPDAIPAPALLEQLSRQELNNNMICVVSRLSPSRDKSISVNLSTMRWRVLIHHCGDTCERSIFINEARILEILTSIEPSADIEEDGATALHSQLAKLQFKNDSILAKVRVSLLKDSKDAFLRLKANFADKTALEMELSAKDLSRLFEVDERVHGNTDWWLTHARAPTQICLLRELVQRLHVRSTEEDTLELYLEHSIKCVSLQSLSREAAIVASEELTRHIHVRPDLTVSFTGGITVDLTVDGTGEEQEVYLQDIEDMRCLSLIASGGHERQDRVPGACAYGSRGLVWRYVSDGDAQQTQLAANFFRDRTLSSLDSVLVLLTYALENPTLGPLQVSWETRNNLPPTPTHEILVEGCDIRLPALPCEPRELLSASLVNKMSTRLAENITTLTDESQEGIEFISAPSVSTKGFHDCAVLSPKGFRRSCSARFTLRPDPSLVTSAFGVTVEGATPNAPHVTARNVWHCDRGVAAPVNRVRTCSDYLCVLRAKVNGSANDPVSFAVHLRDGRFHQLHCSALSVFIEHCTAIHDQRERDAKAQALCMKIENALLAQKELEKRSELILRSQRQRAIEKKLRQRTSSERGWERRMQRSTLLEVQERWERRCDNSSNTVFFRRIVDPPSSSVDAEAFLQTCQWAIPQGWAGNPYTLEAPILLHDPGISARSIKDVSTTHEAQQSESVCTTLQGQLGLSTSKLEHLADALVNNDDLIAALAKRLQLFGRTAKEEVSLEGSQAMQPDVPQREKDDVEQATYHSEKNAWSDEEDYAWDEEQPDDVLGPLPTTYAEAQKFNRLPRDEPRSRHGESGRVPDLVLKCRTTDSTDRTEMQDAAYKWRCFPKPQVAHNILQQCTMTRVRGPEEGANNTPNTPIFLSLVNPADACHCELQQHSVQIEALFIPDARKDMERVTRMVGRNLRKEEELAREISLQDLLAFGEVTGFTSADLYIKEHEAAKTILKSSNMSAEEQALMAAKTLNLAELEDALEKDISPDTTDQYGNTLFILACQQGSKRLIKFLMRRGANVNAQNTAGNTGMHYLHAYGHSDLAEYVRQKGADDTILNANELTCYEGLNLADVDSL